MKTITFSAIKGGVGKSSLAILTANCLASSGLKILTIDADPQNSLSFYYNPDSLDTSESLAHVFAGDNIQNNIIPTAITNINLVPSSLELIRQRDCEPNILGAALSSVASQYDFCIIDTAPTYDNVVLNCILAADKIIVPAQLSSFDYKSALFYRGLLMEAELEDRFKIAFNRFKRIQTGTSINAQFLETYIQTFNSGGQILKNRIPDSAVIRQYFDTGSKITKSKQKINVFNAIKAFAEEVAEIEIIPEAF